MPRLLLLALVFLGALRAETVLVIPFFNHSKAPNLDWIGESIAETVRDALASQGLLVLHRTDTLEGYRRASLRPGAEFTHASVIKLGQALDASRVIYGEYEVMPADGPQLKAPIRITAHMIDLKHTRQGPGFGENGALEDLAALEAHLGWQALQALDPQSAPAEREFLKAHPPVRIDAVESYIRGLLASSADQRLRFFTQAVRLDEHYSQPCFQLGKMYCEKKDYKTAAGWLARVNTADPHYLEAQFFLGLCRYQGGDFAGAAQSFQLVAAAVPLNEVYNDLGAAQSRRQQPERAIASFKKAVEGDDTDPDYHFNLAYEQWRTFQYQDAVQNFRAVLERNANDSEATALLGRALSRQGPRAGDPRSEGRERLKTNYEEEAYRQLQAELKKK